MKFSTAAFAAAMACSATAAYAGDQVVDLSSGSASFIGTSPLLQGGDDVIQFANLGAGTYDFLFSLSAQNITGLTATLNGLGATMTGGGVFTFAGLQSSSDAPLILTLAGIPGSNALYSGELGILSSTSGPGTGDQVIDLSSGTGSFIGGALTGGDDVISFVNLAAGTYDFSLSLSAQNIPDLTASLNGQAATVSQTGQLRFANLQSSGPSPFVLTLTGTNPGGGARYSGELGVTVAGNGPGPTIPEPGTLALLGAGFAGLAWRRRMH